MKSAILLLIAVALLAASIWFFHLSGGFLTERDYVAGGIHLLAGLATIRTGVQIARLSVVLHLRS